MKEIKKEIVTYRAFDGKVFEDRAMCEEYEHNMANATIRHFGINMPFGDDMTSYTAYFIRSQNEFNILKYQLEQSNEYCDDGDVTYEGNGWYFVGASDCGNVEVMRLSDAMSKMYNALDEITNITMNEEAM